jgi:hypothetical protein
MDLPEINVEELLSKLKVLEEENTKLKTLLENYYNCRKSYYEKNKDTIKQKAKEGLKKLTEENPEKIKEYRRRAYIKNKEKKKKELEDLKNNILNK